MTQQAVSTNGLFKIISPIKHLADTGSSVRGHTAVDGNLAKLLALHCEDDSNLTAWLRGEKNFMSPTIQNEIISLMGNSISQQIISQINSQAVQFGNDVGYYDISSNVYYENFADRYFVSYFSDTHKRMLNNIKQLLDMHVLMKQQTWYNLFQAIQKT